MAEAGALLAEVHVELAAAVRPGVTTAELDALAEDEIRSRGAEPGFLGYAGYPATLNTSVNDEIVHGLPSPRMRLRAGDVLSIDCGVRLGGFYSDAACTWIVGGDDQADDRIRTLVRDTRTALWAGIAAARLGARVGDVSAAIAAVGASGGYGIVADHDGRTLGGHGIGRSLWEDPPVPARGRAGRGLRLKPGIVIAIEPMFTLGTAAWRTGADGWTVTTADGSVAAHAEHTVAITETGTRILTAMPGELHVLTGPDPIRAGEVC